MPVLVRTWNVFHGNVYPPRRRGYLREMVELAVRDDPDVVCLQEVPVWAAEAVPSWTASSVFVSVARRPRLPDDMARALTRLHLGLLRSTLTGQANLILVSPRRRADPLGEVAISVGARERRTAHAVRVDDQLVVANLHATNDHRHPNVPLDEVARARAFAEALARPGEPVVLAGDFNVRDVTIPGYSLPAPAIDHVLVRGERASTPYVWPIERRMLAGVVFSDHPIVEVTVG